MNFCVNKGLNATVSIIQCAIKHFHNKPTSEKNSFISISSKIIQIFIEEGSYLESA